MLFTFVVAAEAAVALGYPCQRLNWAWRNVWTTCGINAFVPGSALIPTPSPPNAFVVQLVTSPVQFQLDTNGVFAPGSLNAGVSVETPSTGLCATAPNTGGSLFRNRCRRMLDVYGNLVFLCKTPAKSNPQPNAVSPDYMPQTGHQPHALNAASLAFFSQQCLTPGASFPTPSTVCPGLMGWFTVVWNACGFAGAPAPAPNTAVVANIPNLLLPTAVAPVAMGYTGGVMLSTTTFHLCGAATSPATFNVGGMSFKGTRCRRAIDQFGRSASRCNFNTAPQTMGILDPLRGIAQQFAPNGAQGSTC